MGGKLIENAKEFSGFSVEASRLSFYPDWHPRFDIRSTYEPPKELVSYTLANGVPNPIDVEVVKKDTEVEGRDGKTHTLKAGIYVIDGHQRTNAALEAQREQVKNGEKAATVMVKVLAAKGSEDYLAGLSLAANQRVTDSPTVTAEKLTALVKRYAGDVGRAAVESGYTKSFVVQHLALLNTAPAVQKAVDKGELAVSAAAQLAKVPAEEQKAALETAIQGAEEKHASATAKGKKADGRKKAKVSVKEVVRAAKKVKAAKQVPVKGTERAPGASEHTEAPGKREIKAMRDKAESQGAHGIARALTWVLTGEGDPLGV